MIMDYGNVPANSIENLLKPQLYSLDPLVQAAQKCVSAKIAKHVRIAINIFVTLACLCQTKGKNQRTRSESHAENSKSIDAPALFRTSLGCLLPKMCSCSR